MGQGLIADDSTELQAREKERLAEQERDKELERTREALRIQEREEEAMREQQRENERALEREAADERQRLKQEHLELAEAHAALKTGKFRGQDL